MSTNIDINSIDINSVSEEQVPDIVYSQYEYIAELDKKIQIAMQRAHMATQSANAAASEKVGFFFGKRKAIQATQQAALDNATANEANAEALKIVFEYQKNIGQILKGLFALGTTSIAMNRATICNLESILREGSSAKLSDATKQELLGVIRDLKAQEDFMQKQNKTETTVKQHEKRVKKLEKHQKLLSAIVLCALLLTAIIAASTNHSIQIVVPANTNDSDNSANSIETTIPQTETSSASTFPDSNKLDVNAVESKTSNSLPTNLENGDTPTEIAGNTLAEDVEKNSYQEERNSINNEELIINMDDLVGEARIRGLAYFRIFKKDGDYYFNFVVSSGSRYNYLDHPAPLTVDGQYAVASYSDDNQGNSGTVRISYANGKRYITAEINNDDISQYNDWGDLNALILDNAEMYYDEEIKEYPIYLKYLASDNIE